MKKNHILLCFFTILLWPSFASTLPSEQIGQINQAIIQSGATWRARENWMTRLSSDEQKLLGGARPELRDTSNANLLHLTPIETLPADFDWRNNNGNWMTPVKQQGLCGSCWDFAAVAAVEAWWKIHYARPDSQIDLSEQFILSCSDATCFGWIAEGALELIKTIGVPMESCMPFQDSKTISCSQACANWEAEAVRISDWGYITLDEPNVKAIKNAVFRRPAIAWMEVYEDFLHYSGGVYQYVWGNLLAYHYVVIVGWNDAEQSWICKNSYGPTAGENGYFRIKWGQCKIGTYCPYIWDEQTESAALKVIPNKLEFAVSPGDSLIEELIIQNIGLQPLEYTTLDVNCTAYFHTDSYLATGGLAWWCGDPSTKSYHNNWLQSLETPVIDLSKTNQPLLSFKGYWDMQDTSGIFTTRPFDGWDGCNVWISTDGGKSFEVVQPVSPKYTAQKLYCFSFWQGFGKSIPGWTGKSNGWKKVELDLSSYRSDSVVVQFTLCSIVPGFLPPPRFRGLFVDNISITDDTTIIFQDDGSDPSHLFAKGETNNLVDWIEIFGTSGLLAAGESGLIKVVIRTDGLEPGTYQGGVTIFSNNLTGFRSSIPINLKVLHPVQVEQKPAQRNLPGDFILCPNFPNPFNPTTTIQFEVPKQSHVRLTIYDVLGREVKTLLNRTSHPGAFEIPWDGADESQKPVAGGVYFCRMEAGDPSTSSGQRFVKTIKLVLVR